jgi:phosphate transport system protein
MTKSRVGILELGAAVPKDRDAASRSDAARPGGHAFRAYDHLWAEALNLAAIVEAAFTKSVTALREHRPELAADVKATKREIYRSEVEIERECLRILALYEPMASDFRRVVAILRINRDLERIGDLAARIAKRVKKLAACPDPALISETLEVLAQGASGAVRASLAALVEVNAQLARTVIAGDRVINRYRRTVNAGLKESIRRDPKRIEMWLWLSDIARDLERIGDHAAGIAESVIYLQEGQIVRHTGGHSDATSCNPAPTKDGA